MISQLEVTRHYSATRLITASHPQIIRLMHANCVLLVKQSFSADPVHRRNLLVHAQNLLAELEASLKVTDEVSKSLFYLYDYCYCLLESSDPANHNLVITILSLLRDTFTILLKNRNYPS